MMAMQFTQEDRMSFEEAMATFPYGDFTGQVSVLLAMAPADWHGDWLLRQQLVPSHVSQELLDSLVRTFSCSSRCWYCLLST